MSLLLGLLAGLALAAAQAAAILAFAHRYPDAWRSAGLVALPLVGLFVALGLLVDDPDFGLGLFAGQIALVALGPELAERARRRDPREPVAARLRQTLWLCRAVQLLALGGALYAWFGLDDRAAAVPAVTMGLALERGCRYVRKLQRSRLEP